MLKSDTQSKSSPKTIPHAQKGHAFTIEVLDQKEIVALLKQGSPRSPTDLRNRALIVTLWRGLVGISVALSLKPADVRHDSIWVLKGKGGKARLVGFNPEEVAVTGRWMVYRKEKWGSVGRNPCSELCAGGPSRVLTFGCSSRDLAGKPGSASVFTPRTAARGGQRVAP